MLRASRVAPAAPHHAPLAWRAAPLLLAALLPLAGQAEEPGKVGSPVDRSVMLQISLGGGGEWVAGDEATSVAAGFDLLFHRGGLVLGPFVFGGGGKAHDSLWYGATAGWAVDPGPSTRLELLAEGGVHSLGLESEYAGEPTVRTSLPFLGVRAAAYVLAETYRSPLVAWARRAGIGLQVLARTDLRTSSLTRAVPPGIEPPAPVKVGGQALAIAFSTVLEW